MKNDEISRSDLLALQRTKLANERTFLAYFRTFVVFLSSGFAILKIQLLHSITTIGYFFIVMSFIVALIGIVRFLQVKKIINTYFK